ncbi:twin-arginine translocase TatA/TatE family subunit [candidate division WWE3 bacterium CG10_big_fil_rev_8_21_14_0_10_48_23]|uniref:Twin-arginine translocase TatA/TatE family subunit n=1 Tax=candidate division WWE3 bacterium CG_4_9_14_0_2_um_filter_48_10 TaxID=1975078 RepID=A0A2M8EIZ0_UNCKA|nr:MAG: twin-arginine translocase TatA/TatE family subunit [candidate division WWE3 bacterium CG_4_9_14_0_2_um_filter_48_10]PJE51653.1 MAG: twin-arginine translocase TatA/TatE family subunit [candidate division WWE3 bacterium CG10_big_fil_rev_8_21_14_0_10_48_23]
MQNLGTPEIILLSSVLLLFFGPKKLPEFSRGLGQSIKEVRNGFRGPKKKEVETA